MASKGTVHETCLRNLLRELPKLVGDKATLQFQAPIDSPRYLNKCYLIN